MASEKDKESDKLPTVPSLEQRKEEVPCGNNGHADVSGISSPIPHIQIGDTHGMPPSSQEMPLSSLDTNDDGSLVNLFHLPDIDWDCSEPLFADFSCGDWNINAGQLPVFGNTAPAANEMDPANSINGHERSKTDQHSLLTKHDVSGNLQVCRESVKANRSGAQRPQLMQNPLRHGQITPPHGLNIVSGGTSGAGINGVLTTRAQFAGTEIDGSLLTLGTGAMKGIRSKHAIASKSFGPPNRADSNPSNPGTSMLHAVSILQNNEVGFAGFAHDTPQFSSLQQNFNRSSNPRQNVGGFSHQMRNINGSSGQVNNGGSFCSPAQSDSRFLQLSGYLDVIPSQMQNVGGLSILPHSECGGNLPLVVGQEPNHGVPSLNLGFRDARFTDPSADFQGFPATSSVPYNRSHIGMNENRHTEVSRQLPSSLVRSNSQSASDQLHIGNTSSKHSLASSLRGAAKRNIIRQFKSGSPGRAQAVGHVQCTDSVHGVSGQGMAAVGGPIRASGVPLGSASKRSRTNSPPSQSEKTRAAKSHSHLSTQIAPAHAAGTALRPLLAQRTNSSSLLSAQTAPPHVPPSGTTPLSPSLTRGAAPFRHPIACTAVWPQASLVSNAPLGPSQAQTASFHHSVARTAPHLSSLPKTVLPPSAGTTLLSQSLGQSAAPSHHPALHTVVWPPASLASTSQSGPSLAPSAAPSVRPVVRTFVRPPASPASTSPSGPSLAQTASLNRSVARTAPSISSLPRTVPPPHIRRKAAAVQTPVPSGRQCYICKRDLSYNPEGPISMPANPPPVAILPCRHHFHASCLERITPENEANHPPCIPCAVGDKN